MSVNTYVNVPNQCYLYDGRRSGKNNTVTPLNGMTDMIKNIILPQTSFVISYY